MVLFHLHLLSPVTVHLSPFTCHRSPFTFQGRSVRGDHLRGERRGGECDRADGDAAELRSLQVGHHRERRVLAVGGEGNAARRRCTSLGRGGELGLGDVGDVGEI